MKYELWIFLPFSVIFTVFSMILAKTIFVIVFTVAKPNPD